MSQAESAGSAALPGEPLVALMESGASEEAQRRQGWRLQSDVESSSPKLPPLTLASLGSFHSYVATSPSSTLPLILVFVALVVIGIFMVMHFMPESQQSGFSRSSLEWRGPPRMSSKASTLDPMRSLLEADPVSSLALSQPRAASRTTVSRAMGSSQMAPSQAVQLKGKQVPANMRHLQQFAEGAFAQCGAGDIVAPMVEDLLVPDGFECVLTVPAQLSKGRRTKEEYSVRDDGGRPVLKVYADRTPNGGLLGSQRGLFSVESAASTPMVSRASRCSSYSQSDESLVMERIILRDAETDKHYGCIEFRLPPGGSGVEMQAAILSADGLQRLSVEEAVNPRGNRALIVWARTPQLVVQVSDEGRLATFSMPGRFFIAQSERIEQAGVPSSRLRIAEGADMALVVLTLLALDRLPPSVASKTHAAGLRRPM